jgi:predicted glycoside hydrolase/deacetylase ChbG (UPF0249 family)
VRGKWLVDAQDLDGARREVERQLTAFVRLTGSPPTHIDSHHHFHRLFNVARLFLEAGRRYGVPVRGFSEVVYVIAEEGIRLVNYHEYALLFGAK